MLQLPTIPEHFDDDDNDDDDEDEGGEEEEEEEEEDDDDDDYAEDDGDDDYDDDDDDDDDEDEVAVVVDCAEDGEVEDVEVATAILLTGVFHLGFWVQLDDPRVFLLLLLPRLHYVLQKHVML